MTTENYVERFKIALMTGRPVPQDIADWILSAFGQFESGLCKTLCRALGLRQPGHSSLATKAKLKARNDLIRTIAKQYSGSPTDKAKTISEVLRQWPLGAGELKPMYKMLKSLDVAIPGCNQIENIIRQEN